VVILREWKLTHLSEQVRARRERKVAQTMIRDHGIGAQILADLGISDIIRLSNHPRPLIALEGYGLSVIETRPIPVGDVR